MKKIMVFIFLLSCAAIFSGCAEQTQNAPVIINQQAGVADILEQDIAEAEAGTDPVDGSLDGEETVITESAVIPAETIIPTRTPAVDETESDESVDVDLTTLSSTMVYAEVYSMLSTPRNYIGKIIRMRGDYSVFHDQKTDVTYHACLIRDATACCAQGLEFVLSDDYKYPDDYPEPGDDITIVGQFNFYSEGDYIYYNIIDAVWEK